MSRTTAIPLPLMTRGHPGWDASRRAFNLAVDQQPPAVARPTDADGVRAAVRYAVDHDLRVAAQSTGHGARALGPLSGTLLLRTDAMRDVRVDAVTRTARVAAGARWRDVQQAADGLGLAGLAGSSPTVGVAGYALGGGIGWLGRKHGLCANSVSAFDVVTADGEARRVDATHETDLFWALRGGGGAFAVVTALELRLVPLVDLAAGLLWWPLAAASDVLHAWGELTAGALPDALTTTARLVRVPDERDVPERVRGGAFVVIDVAHLGAEAEARRLLEPLLRLRPAIDTIGLVPGRVLGRLHMAPEHPVPFVGDGMGLARFPSAAVDELVRVARPGPDDPLLLVEVRHLGGELRRARPANGALAALDASHLVYAGGQTHDHASTTTLGRGVRALQKALRPWAASKTYLNFSESRRNPATYWTPQSYARLRRIKGAVDRENRIRSNHPVPSWPST